MSRILFYSTNNAAPKVSFSESLLNGLAPDQGLYMPVSIPEITMDEIESYKDMTYPEIAQSVLWKFLDGDFDYEVLKKFCHEAYNFDIPIEKVDERLNILRLDRGPTSSFKDFAARLMARLFNHVLEKKGGRTTILTATSGDTGSAVANAYYGLERINVIILYPRNEISELQRRQMTTIGGNIRILSIDGKFDDCQALVRRAFSDGDLLDLNLSSANSINIGRLLPQSVYYFYAWSRIAKRNERIIFSVPSGNFGNLLGGIIASRMGLPVKKFIVSVNENDEFPKFINSGIYNKVEPSKNCISSAMNVGHPGNLARLLDLYGGFMNEAGRIVSMPDMKKIREEMDSYTISDQATRDIIKGIYSKYKILLEPHGAVAWGGFISYNTRNKLDSNFPIVIMETAHPAKFADIVKECTGVIPVFPESLSGIDKRDESYMEMESDYTAFRNYLIKGDGEDIP